MDAVRLQHRAKPVDLGPVGAQRVTGFFAAQPGELALRTADQKTWLLTAAGISPAPKAQHPWLTLPGGLRIEQASAEGSVLRVHGRWVAAPIELELDHELRIR